MGGNVDPTRIDDGIYAVLNGDAAYKFKIPIVVQYK